MATQEKTSHQKTMPADAGQHANGMARPDHGKGHSANGMSHPGHNDATHRVVVQDVFCTEVYTDGHLMASSYEDALVQGVAVAEAVAATATDDCIVWKIYTNDDDILIMSGVIQTEASQMAA